MRFANYGKSLAIDLNKNNLDTIFTNFWIHCFIVEYYNDYTEDDSDY